MLWQEKWRAGFRRLERLPYWLQLVVLVPFGPALGAGCLACVCPRAVLLAAGAVGGVYGLLLWAGILTWTELGEMGGRAAEAVLLCYILCSLSGLLGAVGEALGLNEPVRENRQP